MGKIIFHPPPLSNLACLTVQKTIKFCIKKESVQESVFYILNELNRIIIIISAAAQLENRNKAHHFS